MLGEVGKMEGGGIQEVTQSGRGRVVAESADRLDKKEKKVSRRWIGIAMTVSGVGGLDR